MSGQQTKVVCCTTIYQVTSSTSRLDNRLVSNSKRWAFRLWLLPGIVRSGMHPICSLEHARTHVCWRCRRVFSRALTLFGPVPTEQIFSVEIISNRFIFCVITTAHWNCNLRRSAYTHPWLIRSQGTSGIAVLVASTSFGGSGGQVRQESSGGI